MTNRTEEQPRILLIAPQPFFQWRGSPIRVGFDALALAQLGFAVDLLVLPVGDAHEIPGVRVLRAANPLRVRDVPIGPSPIKAFFDLLLLLKGAGLVRRNRYLAVHGIEEAGAVAVLLARLGRCRAVFEKHSDPSSHRKGALRNAVLSLYARVEAWTIRHADAVVATGPGLAEQARRVPGAPPCHWIPDIPSSLVQADPARVREARARLAPAPDAVLVMYVGSFAVYQGVDLMFDAIARAAPRDPRLRFVIVGGSPAEVEARTRALAAQGLADRVLFPGKIPPDDLPHTLAAADILLSPRLSGVNTPLKLLDYMKAGGAIVAARTAANTLILDDDTAELTAPDAAAFADGILRLAGDADRRRGLSAAAGAHIARFYNFDEFKSRLRRCYAELPRPTRKEEAQTPC
jgi:glycosyltransferase involved in cell wall biosynthesis